MPQPSGFVPINFRAAGVLLLAAGLLFLMISGVAWMTGWFVVSEAIPIFGAAASVISVYILFTERSGR